MIMKLAAENYLQPYPESFFDETIETNYYAQNVSSYIQGIFESNTIAGTDSTWGRLRGGLYVGNDRLRVQSR